MGGGYYDRDVYSTSNTSSSSGSSNTSNNISSRSYTSVSQKVFQNTFKLNKMLDPTAYKNKKIKCSHKNPIVCALDVTGSMGDWTKIIYDKLPMFYGQIMMQGYLPDPSISFCGVGDSFADDAALQVTKFGQGKQIDNLISKCYLEGGGGGGTEESYQLAAYFYGKKMEMKKDALPFFFFTGDENFYDVTKKNHIKEFMGENVGMDVDAMESFKLLKKKFKNNVFLLKKPYWSIEDDKEITANWEKALGKSNVLVFKEAKAIVDIMLGVVSIVSGSRTLKEYLTDMKNRGQDSTRISKVRKVLFDLSQKMSKSSGGGGSLLSFRNTNDGGVSRRPMQSGLVVEVQNDNLSGNKKAFKKMVLSLEKEKDEQEEEILKLKSKLRKIRGSIGSKDFPDEFLCPISSEVFVDPVITETGQTYERKHIEKWFQNHNTDPLTNVEVQSKKVIPNVVLKKLIREFVAKNK